MLWWEPLKKMIVPASSFHSFVGWDLFSNTEDKALGKKVNINYPFALNTKLLSHSTTSDANNDLIVSSVFSPHSTSRSLEAHVWVQNRLIWSDKNRQTFHKNLQCPMLSTHKHTRVCFIMLELEFDTGSRVIHFGVLLEGTNQYGVVWRGGVPATNMK